MSVIHTVKTVRNNSEIYNIVELFKDMMILYGGIYTDGFNQIQAWVTRLVQFVSVVGVLQTVPGN